MAKNRKARQAVVIGVKRGVAYVWRSPRGVAVHILDYDWAAMDRKPFVPCRCWGGEPHDHTTVEGGKR